MNFLHIRGLTFDYLVPNFSARNNLPAPNEPSCTILVIGRAHNRDGRRTGNAHPVNPLIPISIIGFSAAVPYRAESRSIRPGQLLVLYADGVTKASNPSAELYGHERLKDLIRHHAEDHAQQLLSRIRASNELFAEGAPRHDDITMLVVKAD